MQFSREGFSRSDPSTISEYSPNRRETLLPPVLMIPAQVRGHVRMDGEGKMAACDRLCLQRNYTSNAASGHLGQLQKSQGAQHNTDLLDSAAHQPSG